ncbi:hypothetical protein HYFRA_00010066 [Hymenoscyphus fraxineus]|uniref:Uncharacterized protein n=1 Tax=Hymenoscyphus fraxineus TaxID=746836 RepID=A0A9N9KY40_9HELO|nr:hypothetical protein HYFRA_00010066 [Hymenoscyphus fraxineus]
MALANMVQLRRLTNDINNTLTHLKDLFFSRHMHSTFGSPRNPHPAAGQLFKRPETLNVNSRAHKHGSHWIENRIRCHLDPQVLEKAIVAVSSLHTTATQENYYIPCPRTISSAAVNTHIHFSCKSVKESREPTKFPKTKQRPAHAHQVTDSHHNLPRGGHVLTLLVLEFFDLEIQFLDCTLRGLNRRASLMAPLLFFHPSIDPVLLFANTALLGVDLGADFTLLWLLQGVHDQLHTTGLASPILLGAVLTEVSPLVAVADHSVLVVKTHFGEGLYEYAVLRGIFILIHYHERLGCGKTNSPSIIALKPDGHDLTCSSAVSPPPAFTFYTTDNAFLQVLPFCHPRPPYRKRYRFPCGTQPIRITTLQTALPDESSRWPTARTCQVLLHVGQAGVCCRHVLVAMFFNHVMASRSMAPWPTNLTGLVTGQ